MVQPNQEVIRFYASLLTISLIISCFAVVTFFSIPRDLKSSLSIGAGEFLQQQNLNLHGLLGDRINLLVRNRYENMYFGIVIENFDWQASVPPKSEKTLTILLNKVGEYTVKLSLGRDAASLYEVKSEKLVVDFNYSYFIGYISTFLLTISLLIYTKRESTASGIKENVAASTERRLNLLRSGIIYRIARSRGFQFTIFTLTLLILLTIILTGLFGTTMHSLNFSTVFVWIVWLCVLVAILIPFFARIWCYFCPLPAYGEWLQRKAFVVKRKGKPLTLANRWPKKMGGLWFANFTFIITALISEASTFSPRITGYLLLSIVLVAIMFSIVFERRTFCRYICPISSFLGIYSLFSSLEVRVKNFEICKDHLRQERCTAYEGKEEGYGCPWFQYLPTMNKNVQCGLCMECIRTCVKDNIGIYLRAFGKDLLAPNRSLDEAFGAHTLLSIALFHIATTQGPLQWLREWGRALWSDKFVFYTVFFLSFIVIVPSVFLVFCYFSKILSRDKDVSLRTLFIGYSYSTIPLGLMTWIAFVSSIFLKYFNYAFTVISDPFGWGWNLFGTRGYSLIPFYPQALPYIQITIILIGLTSTIYITGKMARLLLRGEREAWKSSLPIVTFASLFTLLLIRFFT